MDRPYGLDGSSWHGNKYGCDRLYWLDWVDRPYGLDGLDRLDGSYGNSCQYGCDGAHRPYRYFRPHGSSRPYWC